MIRRPMSNDATIDESKLNKCEMHAQSTHSTHAPIPLSHVLYGPVEHLHAFYLALQPKRGKRNHLTAPPSQLSQLNVHAYVCVCVYVCVSGGRLDGELRTSFTASEPASTVPVITVP